jgi:PH-interacting protein
MNCLVLEALISLQSCLADNLFTNLVIQGHREYLEASKVKEKGPWKQYDLRSVEFCRITNLDYHIEPGGGTSSKLELEFIDMDSSACGCKFQLTWPELTDYPDFLVEKSRFDAAMAKGWVARDHCKVWWASEKGADDKGQWWDGRIKTIKAKSDDFPDSPWEKYIVTYRESAEPQAHSPWELFDRNCSIPEWVVPQIEEDERDELLQAIYDIEEGLSDDEEVREDFASHCFHLEVYCSQQFLMNLFLIAESLGPDLMFIHCGFSG